MPGFKDNVDEKNIKTYNNFKNKLLRQSQEYCNEKENCLKALLIYVEFFSDNHSSIYSSNKKVDDTKPGEVEKFIDSEVFKETEIIHKYSLNIHNKISNIENVYEKNGGTYTVAIIKSKTTFRDYVGVITDSKTPLWIKGQVNFELKKVGTNSFHMYSYGQNHRIRYFKNVKFRDGILNDEWFNINLKEKKVNNVISARELIFKEIDKHTNYMYIPTFSSDWKKKFMNFMINMTR